MSISMAVDPAGTSPAWSWAWAMKGRAEKSSGNARFIGFGFTVFVVVVRPADPAAVPGT
jgi:hypothetical protein